MRWPANILHDGVFPTRVGMVRLRGWRLCRTAVFPTRVGMVRLDGGEGDGVFVFPTRVGMVRRRAARSAAAFVFPTRVGMVRWSSVSGRPARGFPHPRGDGPFCARGRLRKEKFSPPAWGWSDIVLFTARPANVFPTRVGMVRTAVTQARAGGFSPPAWGWSGIRWTTGF